MHHFISFILRFAYAAAFGYILLFHSEDIIHYIPLLLGGLLMLEVVGQMLELLILKLKTKVNNYFFVTPACVLVYALFLIFQSKLDIDPNVTIREIFNPTGGWSNLKWEMQIAGFCLLAFIVSEIVISIAYFKPLYQPKKFAEEKALQEEAMKALEAERSRQAEENAAKNAADATKNAPAPAVQKPESPESSPINAN